MGRITNAPRPEVGADAPEFSLPSAQGGNLRLGMRTVRGPVVVAFFRGVWSEDDIEFFEALAASEDDINAALGSVVGVGFSEPPEAREFQRRVGLKSYVLYDHNATVIAGWGLLEDDPEHGRHALPATFIVDKEGKVSAAWTDTRPRPEELLAAVSAITGLPKAPEKEEKDEEGKDGKEGEGKVDAEEKPTRRVRRKSEKSDAGTDSAETDSSASGGSEEDPSSGDNKEAGEGEKAGGRG